MTHEQIAEQARKEAREAWVNTPLSPRYVSPEDWKHGYASALIHERTKPQPSVEEVMAVWRKEAELHGAYSPHREERFRDRLTKLFNK